MTTIVTSKLIRKMDHNYKNIFGNSKKNNINLKLDLKITHYIEKI